MTYDPDTQGLDTPDTLKQVGLLDSCIEKCRLTNGIVPVRITDDCSMFPLQLMPLRSRPEFLKLLLGNARHSASQPTEELSHHRRVDIPLHGSSDQSLRLNQARCIEMVSHNIVDVLQN